MNLHQLTKKILDTPPRQIYYELQGKTLRRKAHISSNVFSPVFVLSTGRVGTETLDALFQHAPNVFSHHEPAPTLYRLSKLAYEHQENPLAQNILREAFLTTRADLLTHSMQCGKGYIETSPQVTFLAPMILDALPNARFIYLIRDPRAVIRSGMRRKWYDRHPNDSTRITPKPNSAAANQWGAYSLFQKNLWLWSETNRWILQFLETAPQEQKIFLRAEDMFAAQESDIQNLFNFIQSPTPSKQKIKSILGKRLNVQQSGDFPEASAWSEEMNQMLKDFAGDLLTRFDYGEK